MGINCLVVDDDPAFCLVISRFVKKTDFLNLVGTCSTAIEASETIRNNEIDLLFLDIEMPEMTGLELLDTLKEKPEVVLITSNNEYAVDSYNYDVVDYLLKPTEYSRFLIAATKAKDRIESEQIIDIKKDHLFVKSDSKLTKIVLKNLIYIEALKDYIAIITTDGKYIVYSTMKKIEEKLNPQQFARIHRSYIVNIARIKDIVDNNLLIESKLLPIGSSYKEHLKSKLNIL